MTDGPLFVIGCPRSGTTLLLDLLAGTRAFGYVATGGGGRDADAAVHGRTRIYDTALIGDLVYRHRRTLLGVAARLGPLRDPVRDRLPIAIEPWEFWEDLLPNFRPEMGGGAAVDPRPSDLDDAHRGRARTVVRTLLARQRRDIMLSKYTDFPRIDLIRSVFPDARFVHIRRDPFAVANSYATEIEQGRFATWADREWWAAEWPATARHHWVESGETILGFAAHNRNRLVDLIDRAVESSDAPVLEVTYEALTADTGAAIRSILAFANRSPRADIGRLVAARAVVGTNSGWQRHRSAAEAALLHEVFSTSAPWPVA